MEVDNDSLAKEGAVEPVTTAPSERYCPLCNQRTEVVNSMEGPFIITSCSNCGFTHSVKDAPREEPTNVFPFWSYIDGR